MFATVSTQLPSISVRSRKLAFAPLLCACCRIVLSMRLLQSLAAAGASLLHLCFPFLFLSICSNMVAPAVSAAMDVAAVTISIATSIGAALLPFSASPVLRSLFPLTLNSVITSVRQAAQSSSLLARWPTRRVSLVICQAFTRTHSVVWIPVRALLLLSRCCWDARSGVNSTSRIDCRRPFFNCYRCCRLIALFLFRQDFCRRFSSFCGLAGAGTLAPGSMRCPESIAAVRFLIAIVVVVLSRCFCSAKTFFAVDY